MKFQLKRNSIEAIQFDGTPGGALKVFEQFDVPGAKFLPVGDLTRGCLTIPGGMVFQGDWLAKGPDGYFPITDEELKAHFTPLPEETDARSAS